MVVKYKNETGWTYMGNVIEVSSVECMSEDEPRLSPPAVKNPRLVEIEAVNQNRSSRWIMVETKTDSNAILTNGDVYLMNDDGKTIEVI